MYNKVSTLRGVVYGSTGGSSGPLHE